ncbi:MAG TPA: hypothetical protein VN764_02530 [Polyangiaceae bacterium]|nr:hypothetical protein [Polyangiaceae bacterium]
MALIVPFPAHRSQAARRAQRVFHAQDKLQRAQKQALLFFAMAVCTVAVIMSALELAARIR